MTSFYSRELIQEFYSRQSDSSELHLPQAVGWHNAETQRVRFFVLSQIADLSDKSILDVGCGPGAMYPFFKECFADFKYTGIDLSKDFVEYAHKQAPQAAWLNADFLEHDFKDQKFDYVLASGVVAVKVQDNLLFVQNMIRKMFSLCKAGIAINMLSDFSPEKLTEKALHFYSPTEMFAFCKSLTTFVTLRHDYLKNDFTLYLYRE